MIKRWLHAGPVEDKYFSIVWNQHMTDLFRFECYPTCGSLNRSNINNSFLESRQYSNLIMLLPSRKNESNLLVFNQVQFSHRIFFLTLGKIVFHCTAPSRSRSAWSRCLPILITIFEMCDDKESELFWANCRNRNPLPVLHRNFFLCTHSCTGLPCTKVYHW